MSWNRLNTKYLGRSLKSNKSKIFQDLGEYEIAEGHTTNNWLAKYKNMDKINKHTVYL